MSLRNIIKQIQGKELNTSSIQAFVNRRQDYLHLPAEKIEQLVCGDSTAQYGVYPDEFNLYTFNAGETAADLFTTYHITHQLLQKCPHVKRIILFYSFWNAGSNLSKSNGKWLCPLFTSFLSVPKRTLPFWTEFGFRFKLWRHRHQSPTRPPHPKGWNHPNSFTTIIDTETLFALNFKQATKYGIAEKQRLLAFEKLAKNKEFIIVYPPVRSDYKQLYEKLYKQQIDALYLNPDYWTIIDARDWMEPQYFGDAAHLTKEGAKLFSKKLNQYLNTK